MDASEYVVSTVTVQRQGIAAARQWTTFKRISEEIGRLLADPWALLAEQPTLRTEGYNMAVYWDDQGEGSIQVGVQVVRPFEDTETVVYAEVPGGCVATTAHYGEYSDLGPAHHAVRTWCEEHDRQRAGPYWEVYGHWSDDPAQRRTDVYYLLA